MKKNRFESLYTFIGKHGNPWIPEAPFDESPDANLLIYTYGHELLGIPTDAEDYPSRVQFAFQATVDGAWKAAYDSAQLLEGIYGDAGRSRTETRVYRASPDGLVSYNNSTGSETVTGTSSAVDHIPDGRYFEATDPSARIRLFAPLFLGVL